MACVTDAALSLQGEFQLMWCCVEAQFSFVGSSIFKLFCGQMHFKLPLH